MSGRLIVVGVGFALIILFIAFAFPSMMTAATDNSSTTTFLIEGETEEIVTDTLEIEMITVDQNEENATVRYTDLETFNHTEIELNTSETKTVEIEGEEIGSLLVSIDDNDAATVESNYSSMYGWHPAAQTFGTYLGEILMISAIVVILSFLGAVAKGAV